MVREFWIVKQLAQPLQLRCELLRLLQVSACMQLGLHCADCLLRTDTEVLARASAGEVRLLLLGRASLTEVLPERKT